MTNAVSELGTPVAEQRYLKTDVLTDERVEHLRALNALARDRGQTLAQMALAWLLRDERVTTVLVGASSSHQLRDSVGALDKLTFSADELALIDEHSFVASLV